MSDLGLSLPFEPHFVVALIIALILAATFGIVIRDIRAQGRRARGPLGARLEHEEAPVRGEAGPTLGEGRTTVIHARAASQGGAA